MKRGTSQVESTHLAGRRKRRATKARVAATRRSIIALMEYRQLHQRLMIQRRSMPLPTRKAAETRESDRRSYLLATKQPKLQ